MFLWTYKLILVLVISSALDVMELVTIKQVHDKAQPTRKFMRAYAVQATMLHTTHFKWVWYAFCNGNIVNFMNMSANVKAVPE